MLKPGDKFIRFSKYGSVIKGEVKSVHEVLCNDLRNGVHYKKYSILTTKNYVLELDGTDGQIYKVFKEYTQEEIDSINNKLKKLKDVRHKKEIVI